MTPAADLAGADAAAIARRRSIVHGLHRYALAFLLAFASVDVCVAETEGEAEYRVKAAFLYKFGEYVEWPSDPVQRTDNSLVIGVIGADALADHLAQLVVGRSVNGRPVSVRKMRRGEPLDTVQLLFIGRSENDRLAGHLAAARGHPVLTVTESDQGLSAGSMVNFVIVDDKVRFDIALPAVEEGNLRISARLLSVARKVMGRPS